MGGSLGLALKRRGLAQVGVYARREETRLLALTLGTADAVFETPQAALRGSDVAVFCTPICSIPDVARECAAAFEPGCVVTDVGSTKAGLVKAMSDVFKNTKTLFVGSHPMAGSEKNGMEAARADLYQGAVVAITPLPETASEAIQVVSSLWSGVGAKVVKVTPEQHDDLVARSSHLPHLIAALLATTTGRDEIVTQKMFCGQGFRDTTRVASGSPDVWHDIVKTNHAAILHELYEYNKVLNDLTQLLERKDYQGIREMLENARRLRQELLG